MNEQKLTYELNGDFMITTEVNLILPKMDSTSPLRIRYREYQTTKLWFDIFGLFDEKRLLREYFREINLKD